MVYVAYTKRDIAPHAWVLNVVSDTHIVRVSLEYLVGFQTPKLYNPPHLSGRASVTDFNKAAREGEIVVHVLEES